MTFKLGVVSSYDVLCGNATYSQVILDGLPSGVEAVKIEVPVKIQKFNDALTEKLILKQVSDCDAVNIQMELGLYGATPKASSKLIKKIIKNSKRVSLTMHRVEERPYNLIRKMFNQIKNKQLFSALFEIVKFNVANTYKEIIYCASKNNATFIVHTRRDKKRILDYKPNADVIIHPIVWPDNYCSHQDNLSSIYDHLLNVDDRLVIGLFGFMSDYKNFLQVIRVALNEGRYRILVAGGTHPQSPQYGKHIKIAKKKSKRRYDGLSELEIISDIFMKLDNEERSSIISVHSPEDPDLVHLIKSVDIVAIPYTEVGQSASGIASLAIQFGKRIFFSDTKTSRELFKFLNRTPYMFDTKSDLSLAKTLERVSLDDEYSIFFKGYDFKSNIEAYLKSLKITVEKK